jgi:hypothetical protein
MVEAAVKGSSSDLVSLNGNWKESRAAAAMDWNGIFGYPGGCWH